MKSDSLKQYLRDIDQQYKTGVAREHAYRPALKVLIQSLLPKIYVLQQTDRLMQEIDSIEFIK